MGVQGESEISPLAVGCKGRGQPFALPAASLSGAGGAMGPGRAQSPWPPGNYAVAEPGGSAGDGQSPRKVSAVVPAHTLYSLLTHFYF
jgi:hypothetical protein